MSSCEDYHKQCEIKCATNEIAVFDCSTTVDPTSGVTTFEKQCQCVDPNKNTTIMKLPTDGSEEQIDEACENLQEQCFGYCNDKQGVLEDSTPPCSYNPQTKVVSLACSCDSCPDDNMHLKLTSCITIFLLVTTFITLIIGIVQSQRQNRTLIKRQ